MSADLYLTLLHWDSHRSPAAGEARHDGVSVRLKGAPAIGIEQLAFVEFNPSLRVFRARESAWGERDMTAHEIANATAFLERISSAARAAEGASHG